MFNNPTQMIASWFKYHFKLLKSDDILQFWKCRENFFRALQMAFPQLPFEISEYLKVARIDVWRVGWMGRSWNLQATWFIDNSMSIVAHRVVQVRKKIDRGFLAWNTLLLIKQWRMYILIEIFLVVFLPVREGIQGNLLHRCENHQNHNSSIENPDLNLWITSSWRRANIESDSIR
jgi:hypothetical protein